MPGLVLEGPDDLNCATLQAALQNAGLNVQHTRLASNEYRIFVKDHDEQMTLSTPFRIGKILDECKKMLRRIHNFPEEIKIENGLFFPEQSRFQKGSGAAVSLTEKECDLLLVLWKAYPEHVSKEQLLAQVWGYQTELETHTLETHIYRLRQKIEDAPAQPKALLTHENGYRLSAVE